MYRSCTGAFVGGLTWTGQIPEPIAAESFIEGERRSSVSGPRSVSPVHGFPGRIGIAVSQWQETHRFGVAGWAAKELERAGKSWRTSKDIGGDLVWEFESYASSFHPDTRHQYFAKNKRHGPGHETLPRINERCSSSGGGAHSARQDRAYQDF